jgi:hypothetical protein
VGEQPRTSGSPARPAGDTRPRAGEQAILRRRLAAAGVVGVVLVGGWFLLLRGDSEDEGRLAPAAAQLDPATEALRDYYLAFYRTADFVSRTESAAPEEGAPTTPRAIARSQRTFETARRAMAKLKPPPAVRVEHERYVKTLDDLLLALGRLDALERRTGGATDKQTADVRTAIHQRLTYDASVLNDLGGRMYAKVKAATEPG